MWISLNVKNPWEKERVGMYFIGKRKRRVWRSDGRCECMEDM